MMEMWCTLNNNKAVFNKQSSAKTSDTQLVHPSPPFPTFLQKKETALLKWERTERSVAWGSHTVGWMGSLGTILMSFSRGGQAEQPACCCWRKSSSFLWINDASCHLQFPWNRRSGFKFLREKVHFPATPLQVVPQEREISGFGGDHIFTRLCRFQTKLESFVVLPQTRPSSGDVKTFIFFLFWVMALKTKKRQQKRNTVQFRV